MLFVHEAVEVGFVTCVWGLIGQAARHSTPLSEGTGFCLQPPHEVEDAEVLDTEHVGEDKTGGKQTNGTFNEDMANEMEMSGEKCATQVPVHLEPVRCATLEKCSAA